MCLAVMKNKEVLLLATSYLWNFPPATQNESLMIPSENDTSLSPLFAVTPTQRLWS